jgi:hypothetical protein
MNLRQLRAIGKLFSFDGDSEPETQKFANREAWATHHERGVPRLTRDRTFRALAETAGLDLVGPGTNWRDFVQP